MKRLYRPTKQLVCLNKYKQGRDVWGHDIPSDADRQEIWNSLNQMQGGFCAYCESKLVDGEKEIEHFRQKASGRFPQLTFEWGNLFASCKAPKGNKDSGKHNRCGNYKDNKAGQYDDNDLLKPDEDDFSQYCVFVPRTGKYSVRSNLTESNERRASETLRVFNLNGDTVLVNRRKSAVKAILHQVTAVYELLTDEVLKSLFEEELEKGVNAAQSSEFQTALEHVWQYSGNHG